MQHAPPQVRIADMAAILAQVDGNAIGAGGLGDRRSLGRVGMHAAARVAHGRDVIDVHSEASADECHFKPRDPGLIAGSFASSGGRSLAS